MSEDVRLRAAAVDLGASSGRVVVGTVGPNHLDSEVVHRFPNEPVDVNGRLSWNLPSLWRGILAGIREAGERGVRSIGIDSWGVDYGLLDEAERLIAAPVHYRDSRTDGIMERVRADVGDRTLYATTGVQFMGFNTAYQLLAEDPATLRKARTMLLIPDLLCHRLTGRIGAERTNASTTQLYDVRARTWSEELVRRLGLPRRLLPPLRDPGDLLGPIRSQLRGPLGVSRDVWVTTVGSHDTASAVAAVPAHDGHFAYVSCGTWSLVGLELSSPVLSAASLDANFTNEVGIDGTIRYLRNVMGLWLLQESMRTWREEGRPVSLARLLADAEAEPPLRSVVDAESPDFLAPGDMPERIRAHCRETGQPEPSTPAQVARCVLDSLALAHARNVAAAQRLSGRRVDVVHVVGGGAQNSLLCQLTADACGLPVVAGPVEATALGNLLVQARAHGVLVDRAEARDVVRRTQDLHTYQPRDHERWSALLAA